MSSSSAQSPGGPQSYSVSRSVSVYQIGVSLTVAMRTNACGKPCEVNGRSSDPLPQHRLGYAAVSIHRRSQGPY